MTDAKTKQSTIGGDAVKLTLSKVITLCITLATTMLLSRFRSFQEYGTYSQLLLVIQLASSLLMLGLPNSINYFLARAETEEQRRKFLSLYYVLSTVISLIIGMLLVLSIPLIEQYFKNDMIRSFYYFLALYPWASVVSSSFENVLVVYKRTKILIIYRIAYSIAVLACVLVIQWIHLGFTAYMITFVIVNCVFALLVYFISFHLCGGVLFQFNRSLVRAIFAFSIPMGLATVVGTINTEIDKLLIGYLMDTEQLAIYTNAAKELPLSIVATSITAVLLPQLAKMIKSHKYDDAVEIWRYASELSLIVMSVIIFGIFTYAEEAMTILYSAKYLPGVMVFRIYTLTLILRITYFGMILNACGKTKAIFYCSILSMLLNVLLNPLAYKVLGIVGPAIATLVAILIVQILQLKLTANEMKISFSKVFPWRKAGYIILLNMLFSVFFGIVKQCLPLEQYCDNVIEAIILGVIWGGIYFELFKKRIKTVWSLLNSKEYKQDS